MKLVLYNVATEQVIGYYQDGYYQNGVHPEVTEDMIVLEVVDTPVPEDYDEDIHHAHYEYKHIEDKWEGTWTITDKTLYEIEYTAAIKDWKHPEYEFRMRVPKELGETYPSLYAHIMLEKLPIEDYVEGMVDVYINTILPRHFDLLEFLQEYIEIHNRPTILEANDNISE
jgi:hypothetical protein